MTRYEPLETFTNYSEYVILWLMWCLKDTYLIKSSSEQDQIHDGWL